MHASIIHWIIKCTTSIRSDALYSSMVSNMSDACESIIARNHLSKNDIDWVIPHQANQRIISAVTQTFGSSCRKGHG